MRVQNECNLSLKSKDELKMRFIFSFNFLLTLRTRKCLINILVIIAYSTLIVLPSGPAVAWRLALHSSNSDSQWKSDCFVNCQITPRAS